MIGRIIIFLALNFSALAIGGLFTSKGVSSEWYGNLLKAPWSPAGWIFGFAWTTIMICFAFYMAVLWSNEENKRIIIGLYFLQWVLNIAWNPTFFYYHNALVSLFIIISLTVLVIYFLFNYWPEIKLKSLLILPYALWLIIATSLNLYIVLKN